LPIKGFAADFASAALGTAGRIVLPLLIAASAFGSANGGWAAICCALCFFFHEKKRDHPHGRSLPTK
jgi:hypothetical protein